MSQVSLLRRTALELPTQNHELGGFEQLKCLLSQFWKPGVWKPGVSRTSLLLPVLRETPSLPLLACLSRGPHPPSPCSIVPCVFMSLQGHRSLDEGPPQASMACYGLNVCVPQQVTHRSPTFSVKVSGSEASGKYLGLA